LRPRHVLRKLELGRRDGAMLHEGRRLRYPTRLTSGGPWAMSRRSEAAFMLKVLEGVRLIEVAEWFFVPGAGTGIADWGADVIQIEHPTRGDPPRGLISSGIIPGASGLNFFIENGSRNKRSLGLDLGTDRGREILYTLVEKSDVFLTSFLPAARRRMKID